MRYQSTTGLDHDQIRELTTRIQQVLIPTTGERGGRPQALDISRSVLLTLVLLRQNLSQTVAGDLFGISQPTVSRIYRRFLPLIGQVLCLHTPPLPGVLTGRVVLVDGTLVPTGKRAGHDDHNYSGKRHKAGLSVQLLSDTAGILLAVSTPVPGRTHDRNAYTLTGFDHLLTDTDVIGDLGYQGTPVIRPRRKRPGHKTHSPENTIWNQSISRIRWAVERAIGHWKNWKILATGYRTRLAELPTVLRVVTVLEYYRLGW